MIEGGAYRELPGAERAIATGSVDFTGNADQGHDVVNVTIKSAFQRVLQRIRDVRECRAIVSDYNFS